MRKILTGASLRITILIAMAFGNENPVSLRQARYRKHWLQPHNIAMDTIVTEGSIMTSPKRAHRPEGETVTLIAASDCATPRNAA